MSLSNESGAVSTLAIPPPPSKEMLPQAKPSIPSFLEVAPKLPKPKDQERVKKLNEELTRCEVLLRALQAIPRWHDDAGSRRLAYSLFVMRSVLDLEGRESIASGELFCLAQKCPDLGAYISEVDFYLACGAVGFRLGVEFPDIEPVSPLPRPAMAA